MRERGEIEGNVPGEACSVLDFEILRWYLSLQLEVLLDIRGLLQRDVDTIRADGYNVGFKHGQQSAH